MPTNTITFYAYYPCADISDKLIAGSVNIKRKFEISAGYLGGVKNIDGYQKSINNRGIRLVLEELKGVLKKDTGWMYNQINCIDIDGNELKLDLESK